MENDSHNNIFENIGRFVIRVQNECKNVKIFRYYLYKLFTS